jgi:hypothetical protein
MPARDSRECVVDLLPGAREPRLDFPGQLFVQEGTLDRLDEWWAPSFEIFT